MIYNYEVTDESDHCETSFDAYADIAKMLENLAIEQLKTKETLRIYDPYYCEGSVISNLGKLGFSSVYNQNEDFYYIMENKLCPEFDVIVTNPPYSQSHIEKIILFCIQSLKPFFLLLPNFVYCKDYYIQMVLERKSIQTMLFYVAPKKRYKYLTPKGRRQIKSKAYTSPFSSFWYCCLRRYTDKILSVQGLCDPTKVEVVRSVYLLPIELTAESDQRRKHLQNSLKRKKNKARKKSKISTG